MYHYNPETALEELNEDAALPHPVNVRDMIVRAHLPPEQAVELNRKFQEYLHLYGELQNVVRPALEERRTHPRPLRSPGGSHQASTRRLEQIAGPGWLAAADAIVRYLGPDSNALAAYAAEVE